MRKASVVFVLFVLFVLFMIEASPAQAIDRLFVETDFSEGSVRVRPWYQHNDKILSVHARYNVDGPGMLAAELGHAWPVELGERGKMTVFVLGGPVLNANEWYLRGVLFDAKLLLSYDRLRLFSVFNFVGSIALNLGVRHGLYTFTNVGAAVGPVVIGGSFDAAGELDQAGHDNYFVRMGPQVATEFAKHFFVSAWYSFDPSRSGAQHIRVTVGGQW